MFGGTSQFTFGSTQASNPFGTTATTTATAPASTGFLFGSTPAATAAPSALNSTFTFGTPTATATTAAPAATQPLTFGTGLQNTSTIRPFGSTTAFGTTSASTTPATGATGFGGTSLFGATQPAAQPTSIFGSTTSTFGAPQTAQTTNIFGSTLGTTTTATQMGTTVKFEAVSGQDTIRTKNNTFQTINTKLQCICAMKEYINKSMEELRMEDYQANRKFATTPSVFGATSFASTTPFSPAPYGSTTTFSAAPAASTGTSFFGISGTTTASPFGAAPATSAAPFSFGTSTAPTTNIFGTSAATTASPFGTTTSTAPATTSIFGATQPTATNIFGSTTTTGPFGAKPATTQPAFGFGTTTTTSTASPFSFGSQPATNTSIFSQPATSTPFGTTAPTSTTSIFGVPTSTANPFGTQQTTTNIFGATTSTAAPAFGAATSTPAFTGFGTTAPASTATNIFGTPTVSTATTAPVFGGFGQTAGPAGTAPFSFTSNATSNAPTIFGATAPTATTSSIFNTQPFGGFNLAQTQPAATAATQSFGFSTPFGSTAAPATAFGAQTQMQQSNVVQPVSMIQQRFLAASLLDPFASRGKKNFTNIDQIKPPTDLIVVSTSTTTATTVTTSTSSPITLPLQSNSRKASSARPLVDIRFKLKANTSSPTSVNNNEEIKSPNQQTTTTPTGQVKSPLTADFSEEEEQVLIGRNKMSKLRLSSDFNDTSFQSESIRSLYPVRRLAELEALANMNNNTHIISTVHTIPSSTSSSSSSTTTIDTASAYVSSTTVNKEHTLHPTNNTRGILPLHHSTPLIVHKQTSPTVSHPITTPVPSMTSPPPRSTTPPPPPPTASTSNQRIKFSSSNSDSRAYQLPKLTREDYFMEPSISELKTLFNDKGQCLVKQFRVGHDKYGSVTFYGKVNVAGLDLDRIIEIDRHELTVYPDDNNKPPVGEELNIPARITLLGVYPTDRTTREEIRDIERIKAMNYSEYLREVTKKFDGEFIHYGPEDGSWTFTVKHFTRYGLDGDEDDFVVVKPAPQQKIINPNFLDQTIALNDTYALSSPKTQSMDMEEKENTTLAQQQQQQNIRLTNQSLIGLRPNIVEQLAQSMFCDDDDEDDFEGFQQATDRMITSTKIITSNHQPIPIIPEAIIEKSTTMEQDKTQITFHAPQKTSRERIYSKLPKNVAHIRGKYFRTNFSSQLQYGSIDPFNEKRILLQTPVHFSDSNTTELDEFFEIYFSSCIQQIDPTANLPFFQVRQDANVVQQFIEFYTKILDESKQ